MDVEHQEGTWTQLKLFEAEVGSVRHGAGAGAGDRFGTSVSISGGTIVVGAPNDDDWGSESGAAYVFERNEGGANQWGQVKKLTVGVPSALDRFGSAVAISGNTIVVGSPYDDAGSGSGSAYIHRLEVARVYLPLVLRGSS
jgi:hypothetical protein